MKFAIKPPQISRFTLVILVSAYILAFHNLTFWQKVFNYSHQNIVFTVGTAVMLFAVFNAVIGSFAYKYLLKPVAILFVLIAAGSSYFVDKYGILIDRSMLASVLETTSREAGDILTARLFLNFLIFGILPAVLIAWVKIRQGAFLKVYFQNVAWVLVFIGIIVAIVLPNFSAYASIIRNNRDLAESLHPSQPINAMIRLGGEYLLEKDRPLVLLATDARLKPRPADTTKPKLTVLVLGETARAQSFSLNGYQRETNPELKQRDIINFSNVSSCGTTTETSLPCMFSHFGRAGYSASKARYTENVLDVLNRAGVQLSWIDNNSNSKGQADRIPYRSVANSKNPPYCDDRGCFDEILLEELREQITQLPKKDSLFVLHSLGSHGPTYFERTPDAFKKFMPECATNELDQCTRQQIINSYDNTILYTDFFLAKLIDYLKSQQDEYDTAMLYVSDHGESTGENGLYLHGMPYFIAPESQTRVPMIAWLSEGFAKQSSIDLNCLKTQTGKPFSHDNLFDSLLAMTGVQTSEYNQKLDIFANCPSPPSS